MTTSPTAVLQAIVRLQEIHAGTPHEVIVDGLVNALAADTTVVELRQELAFRDAEIADLRSRLYPDAPPEAS